VSIQLDLDGFDFWSLQTQPGINMAYKPGATWRIGHDLFGSMEARQICSRLMFEFCLQAHFIKRVATTSGGQQVYGIAVKTL
jgi:hypothetical protein